jgi:hypothetical protein
LGFCSRVCTPELVRVAMHLAAEIRSYERTAVSLQRVLGHRLSAKSIERLAGEVGAELATQPARSVSDQQVVTPEVAVVSCDGGRIHTRAPGHGPGVHQARWRETKNASFERMHAPAVRDDDPCPALPDTFRQVAHVAQIAEKAAFEAENPPENQTRYRGPERILRTCLSSLVSSQEFGPQMRAEAERRKFFAAARRVFIGDGLPWNWSLWREHFSAFTPILDFIHAVQYLYAAALAWEANDAARWKRYLAWAEAVWQGRVQEVIAELEAELAARGATLEQERAGDHTRDEKEDATATEDVAVDSALQPLVDAARYLRNNRERMDYPRYRREGLPITSSPMESLIKQINHRVKGSEMFWNAPHGAEAILQLRAASLSEDDRLDRHLRHRPGHPLTRPHPTTAA